MSACERCTTPLTVIQVYRGNRFCSARCANARGHGLANLGKRWCGLLEWQHVLAMLGTEWFMTLSDIAIWRYGDDAPADIEAARQSIYRIKREGYALEERTFSGRPRERWAAIRGYRLAQARKEQVA